jgi:GTPase SAR1 family protein
MKGTTNAGSKGSFNNTESKNTGTSGNAVNLVLIGNTTPITNPKGKNLTSALANILAGGNQGNQHKHAVKRSIGGRTIDVSLQDIEESEAQSHKLQNYTNTDAFVLTFGYNSKPSFESIKGWYNEAKRSAPEATFVLLGVKETSNSTGAVTTQDAQQLAKTLNISTFAECSLDNVQSIEKAFDRAIASGTQNQ